VWNRAKLAAKDDDPQRVEKLARIRYTLEHLPAGAVLFFAGELDISLLPKVGYQWMPKGEQLEVPDPGTNEKRYLAGAFGDAKRENRPSGVVAENPRLVSGPVGDA
jgi:hypothetical protein